MIDKDKAAAGLSMAEFGGLGVQFAAGIVVFTFGGLWLDRRLGTMPLFLLVGLFVGCVGGFYSIYRKATAAQKRDAAARDRAKGGK
jgi:F0F1-type ATP synthase assembly protein I